MLPVHKVAPNTREKGAKGRVENQLQSLLEGWRTAGLGKVWGGGGQGPQQHLCRGSALTSGAQLSICSRQIPEEVKLYVGSVFVLSGGRSEPKCLK